MVAQDRSLPNYEEQWWRALAMFRAVAVLYAVAVYPIARSDYQHVAAGWLVLAGLGVWTALTFFWYNRPHLRRWPLLSADLMVAALAIVSTRFLQFPEAVERGAQTLPVIWVVAPVIAWALVYGWPVALPVTAVIGTANVITRGAITPSLLHNTVLVLVAGTLVGYVAALARQAERQLTEALRAQATTRERERLARAVHDGVLQVLAYVSRRGRELGGEASELARLAGEQEVALRTLITTTPGPGRDAGSERVDLRDLLAALGVRGVSVASPPGPVSLPAATAQEIQAAVAASIDNVEQHAGAGAEAFVLLEDEGDEILVTVRDTGHGFPPGRLDEAAQEGRLGVARSIVGRLADIGGSAELTSRPGDGVEVVLRLPRQEGHGDS